MGTELHVVINAAAHNFLTRNSHLVRFRTDAACRELDAMFHELKTKS
jgi:hypothetical protein